MRSWPVGPGFVAVGEENGRGRPQRRHLDLNGRAAIGIAWSIRRRHSPGTGAQRMYAVAASDIGLVAAGTDVLEEGADEPDPERSLGRRRSGRRSTAKHWIRLPGNDPSMSTLADQGRQEIKALLSDRGRVPRAGRRRRVRVRLGREGLDRDPSHVVSESAGPRRYAGMERR